VVTEPIAELAGKKAFLSKFRIRREELGEEALSS
jgi:hypothetical protein